MLLTHLDEIVLAMCFATASFALLTIAISIIIDIFLKLKGMKND